MEDCAVAPNKVAVMVGVVVEVTLEELMVNVAWLASWGAVTLAGTVSEPLFERRETVAPPEPASKFKRTSHEAEAPPMMGLGLSNNSPNKGDTVRVFCPTPEAVILTRVSDFTGGLAAVVMVKVAVVLCQEDAKASCCTKDEGRSFGAAL
jgi:hypothetical protein